VTEFCEVIEVRGTGEPQGGASNFLRQVTSRLPAERFHRHDLLYPASIGIANPTGDIRGVSEAQSIRQGLFELERLIRSFNGQPVGLLGYSLGAMVVTRFLERQARGEYVGCQVSWAGMVANPLRNEGDSFYQPHVPGYGIAGRHERFSPDVKVWEIANPRDGITCCPDNSPLRTVSDSLTNFSFALSGGWSQDLIDRTLTARWQLRGLWPVFVGGRYRTAVEHVYGYLRGGEHLLAYQAGGYLTRLADVITAQA